MSDASTSTGLGIVRQYRESHHRIAEMVAMGCTDSMIRQRLGVSLRRLSLLKGDPAFQELIAYKRQLQDERVEKEIDLYIESSVAHMIQAELAIGDALEEHYDPDGQKLSIAMLNKISQDRADRFGYSKHSTMDVKHEFASALDRAIARSGKAQKQIEPPVIEVKAVEVAPPPASFVKLRRSA